MKISSKDNPVVKHLFKLYESKKLRDEEGLFIVEGYNLVEEATRSGLVKEVYTVKPEKNYPNAVEVTFDILKKITDTINPEGIIALCEKPKKSKNGCAILYLDHLQDPGNVGTLLRSCCAFGFDTVILDSCVDLYNPKTIRSSEGAIFHLNYSNSSISELKEEGYKIIGTSMNGYKLSEYNETLDKIVIVLGNEGNGVRKEILDSTDINLTIEMNNIESLNVGVAGSILMYKFKK